MEAMHTMASKNSAANGSERASAWIGKTPSSTPASRIRWMFSEALNHRSVAHTCTPNSRRRKIDDDARPQPRSSTRMPGRKSIAAASHSVIQSEFAPPLTLARTHSGWYCEERGKLVEMNRLSEVTVPRFSHDALSGEANEEAQRKRSSVLLAWRLLTQSASIYQSSSRPAHFA